MSIVLFALSWGIFYFGFEGLGIGVGVGQIALFYVLQQLSSYFVITPGNIGRSGNSFRPARCTYWDWHVRRDTRVRFSPDHGLHRPFRSCYSIGRSG